MRDQITITVGLDNESMLDPDGLVSGPALSQVLRDLADKIGSEGVLAAPEHRVILDANGNTIGRMTRRLL